MEASEAMTVVDTLNTLDLMYATSAEELASALQRVSSVAQTAGVSFQDLSSILTVVSSNTRLSAETIGNGLKSLFSRLQNIKVGKYLSDEGRQPCPKRTISVKIQRWTRPSKDILFCY